MCLFVLTEYYTLVLRCVYMHYFIGLGDSDTDKLGKEFIGKHVLPGAL